LLLFVLFVLVAGDLEDTWPPLKAEVQHFVFVIQIAWKYPAPPPPARAWLTKTAFHSG